MARLVVAVHPVIRIVYSHYQVVAIERKVEDDLGIVRLGHIAHVARLAPRHVAVGGGVVASGIGRRLLVTAGPAAVDLDRFIVPTADLPGYSVRPRVHLSREGVGDLDGHRLQALPGLDDDGHAGGDGTHVVDVPAAAAVGVGPSVVLSRGRHGHGHPRIGLRLAPHASVAPGLYPELGAPDLAAAKGHIGVAVIRVVGIVGWCGDGHHVGEPLQRFAPHRVGQIDVEVDLGPRTRFQSIQFPDQSPLASIILDQVEVFPVAMAPIAVKIGVQGVGVGDKDGFDRLVADVLEGDVVA